MLGGVPLAKVGKALAHGAVTIVNALASGKGSALGVGLWTRASVRLTNEPGIIEGKILSDPREDISLIKAVVRGVLRRFGLSETYGAYVETDSNIPIARGLKSSSAAANAIALACISALNEELEDLEIIKLGVEAALEAKVTVTGAFDDACASYFGNLVVTDNLERRILKLFIPEGDLSVLIYVPYEKAYTVKANLPRMRLLAKEVDVAFKEALSGNFWTAMTLNGLIYASALGYDPSIALDALARGALSAGLSGKGPAFAAVLPKECLDNVREAWSSLPGRLIETIINREKAQRLP